MSSSLWRTEDGASYKSSKTIANRLKQTHFFMSFSLNTNLQFTNIVFLTKVLQKFFSVKVYYKTRLLANHKFFNQFFW